ncbi:hypothetical protein BC835DRAFT_1282030 [Cytidiella melzeri]|nr:hypothetical protein BC835DRAFT_1282030 [Cytidiella melzeri]
MNSQKATIFSLYRSFRRQINLLPSEYLRQFFRIKLSDDVRRVLACKNAIAQKPKLSRLRRVSKDFHRVEAANNGSYKSYDRILRVAYGRIGPLKWTILKQLLSKVPEPPPDRIIAAVEKSRPPTYTPELTALLTSPYSRHKPLTKKQLQWPHKLPARADPKSEEARLLGPFSKRREVNIRWREFTQQTKRILPPLQVVVHDQSSGSLETSRHTVERAGIQPLGLQDTGIYEEAVSFAGPRFRRPPVPKRERAARPHATEQEPQKEPTELPRRFLRRRFRQLISSIPVLTYTHNSGDAPGKPGNYTVSGNLFRQHMKSASDYPNADASLLQWLQQDCPEENKDTK